MNDLKEWERNPREIEEAALSGLGNSIDEFGDLSGIVFNVRLQALVAGHQRVKAIKEKYGDTVRIEEKCIVLPTGERFAIRLVDWDETKHAAANVAANNEYISGTYTKELEGLLQEIGKEAPELFHRLNLDRLNIEMGFNPPNFQPAGEDEQGKLDEKEPITCPKCGNEFTP